uniref:Sodium/potassium-transporting ATPase subunit beta-1-interacting protein n=1 Tax=Syphacia muris TaxID=451379 RepID=A0A0N5AXE3_9BILA
MADSPPYMWLTSILTLWLFAAVARQLFDLVGKLWIPVAFNLLQILSCITGLFAVCQHRMCLLLCLVITSVLSVIYNALIILWYTGTFGDFSRPLLSAGLPYSHRLIILTLYRLF